MDAFTCKSPNSNLGKIIKNRKKVLRDLFDDKALNMQQVPEEIERVMLGIEAYLQIRRRVSDLGFSVFEDIDDTEKALTEKVSSITIVFYHLMNAGCCEFAYLVSVGNHNL